MTFYLSALIAIHNIRVFIHLGQQLAKMMPDQSPLPPLRPFEAIEQLPNQTISFGHIGRKVPMAWGSARYLKRIKGGSFIEQWQIRFGKGELSPPIKDVDLDAGHVEKYEAPV
ncbi:MAG: hypothetical protein ACRC9G_11935 [Aeromonas veronii]